MALNNSITSRLGDLRYRNNPTAPGESQSGNNTPSRYSGSFMNSFSQPAGDARASLQRRFTTDLAKMQPVGPIGQQPAQVAEQVETPITDLHKARLLDNKRRQNEELREKRRRFEAELDRFKGQQERVEQEYEHLMQSFHREGTNLGHQSEPTTPPEHRDSIPSSVFSRTNRYSTSTLTSPPGLSTTSRTSRSGTLLASPPNEIAQTLHNHINADTLPSKSVPASRRGSNDKISAMVMDMSEPMPRNAATASHRYSMPVTSTRKKDQLSTSDYSSMMGLGHINTANYLFNDEEDGNKETITSPGVNNYLQLNATDDNFPILVRHPQGLSASSTALDLASPQEAGEDFSTSSKSAFSTHRLSQGQMQTPGIFSPGHSVTGSTGNQHSPEPIGTNRNFNRHSMEAAFSSYARANLANQFSTADPPSSRPSLANLASSLSTNDLPTMKNTGIIASNITPPKTHAEQHFHNHNASLGRIPTGIANNRQSRDFANGERMENQQASQLSASNLKPSGTVTGNAGILGNESPSTGPVSNQYGAQQSPMPPNYGNFGMQMMNMNMNMASLQLANPVMFNQQLATYQQHNGFGQYSNFGSPTPIQANQTRLPQQRRMTNGDGDNQRFMHVRLEDVQRDIYDLCKDQHGCRYLQKKLEEQKPEQISMIFAETNQHVVELMTDPFGNYLCQKLFEYSDDEQRTQLIGNAAADMVKIALNQHGTRALQKMIEFISTKNQTACIIRALEGKVVDLIQDLNGNHVIQKCLNRLTPVDAQFIFTAVGENCVAVGTHRHGCCVLQRCIDHATGQQKANLIAAITAHAFELVQNPFGNYVLQYIIDLQEKEFTDPLCLSFQGQVCLLSKQKFSSNVIEKCIRGADSSTSQVLIREMLDLVELEKLLRDNFANYVVQTAIDYAEGEQKKQLVESIEPLLPLIRQAPYHRRIQNKIHAAKSQTRTSGNVTPYDLESPGQLNLGQAPMTSNPNAYAPISGGFQPMPPQYANGPGAGFQTSAYNPNTASYNAPPMPQPAAYGNGPLNPFGNVNNPSMQGPLNYPRHQSNGFHFF